MNELKKTYENFKMALVGIMNLGLEDMDRLLARAIAENEMKDRRIKELEKELESINAKVSKK